MHLKTILNRVQKFKSFVYSEVRWIDDASAPTIEAKLRPRTNGRPLCSVCGRPSAGYDRLSERRFEFIPMWGIRVFLVYAPRRINCPDCGVRVERMPWTSGKHQLTRVYAWFLAGWAKRLSWKEVATVFRTSWDHVFSSVEMAVVWGLAHRDLSGIEAIGVDEIAWKRGHRYLTLVYQIDADHRRLLWIGNERREKTFRDFFNWFGAKRTNTLKYICSDMWQPYLTVIAEKAGHALNILDRFHIMAHISKAIDKVRAQEHRELKRDGNKSVLFKTRWLLLKRPENLTPGQQPKLAELLRYNLKAVRSYLLKEDFQQFWSYTSPYWAGQFLDGWCNKTMRSKIEPMKDVARTLRRHRALLMNWFLAKGQLSSGAVEGFNNKAKLTTRKAYGFRTLYGIKIALYHALGDLPESDAAHRFF